MKLHFKIMLFFSIGLIVVIGGLSLLIFDHWTDSLETQMGNNAMDIAVTIASIDDVQQALAVTHNYEQVQNYIENFREKTRFQYIIVMDMNGIQYSYPYPSGVGKVYRAGGEEKALEEGKSYVSADRNVFFSAIRAFTPIYYEGEQVGAVLVGLLTEQVNEENKMNRHNLEMTLVLGVLIGIAGAGFLSYNIKKSIYGLEPKEIAILLGQRDLILQSMVRGIIAVDGGSNIIWCNETAKVSLDLPEDVIGQSIRHFPSSFTRELLVALDEGKDEFNKEIRISPEKTVLSSYCLMKNTKDDVIGMVASFEDLTEVKKMAEELTGYRSMVNALRAQNHEFMNKLHTISGLIQLDEYDEVLDYIDQVTKDRISISNAISNGIKNTYVAAILLAKYNKLKEEKINLVIDPNSYLTNQLKGITEDDLCSILGNLIDNAGEALYGQSNGEIRVYLKSDIDKIILKVRDNGKGIPKELESQIFKQGVTTKTDGRGLGLSIVKDIVEQAKGKIQVTNDHGVEWNIVIPNH